MRRLTADGVGAQVNLAHEARFELGDLEVLPATREVVRGGQRQILQPRTMQVLVALARRRGEVVARDDLITTCWAGQTVGDDSLNRCMVPIRQLADASGAFSITTVPRVGYRLEESPGSAGGSGLGVARLSPPRARLIGRDDEVGELHQVLGRALQGQGALVLLAGEPGVGKTRLAEEVGAEAARRGALMLTGRCYQTAGAPPYGPFVEILEETARLVAAQPLREALGPDAAEVATLFPELRKLFDDIPPPIVLQAEQARHYLFNGVRGFLERAARQRPLVLLLDDLHWADESTLALLHHIADRLHELPVLVLGTHRDAETDVAGKFADWWSDIHRRRLGQRLTLRPLTESAGVALIGALGGGGLSTGVSASIYRTTEGNPFFIEEIVKHLADEGRLADAGGATPADPEISEFAVPEGVRLVIGKRLERLGPEAGRALAAAAVVGRRFGVELLEALGLGDADSLIDVLDGAEASRLIVGEAGGYRFAHELIRQTLIASMSLPRRQRLHHQVAEAMEGLFGADAEDHAAHIGHHLRAAGGAVDPAKTARYLRIAGHRALSGAAYDEALTHFQAGLAETPGPNRARAELLFGSGLVRRRIGPWGQALKELREASEIYERLGDPEAAGEVRVSLAGQISWGGDYAGAADVCQRGLAAMGDQRSAVRAELLMDLGYYRCLCGDYAAGDDLLTQASTLSIELGDDEVASRLAYRVSQRHGSAGEWREGVRHACEAVRLLRESKDFWSLADACAQAASGLMFQARWDEAAPFLAEGEALARRFGNFRAQFWLHVCRGWSGLARGEGPTEFAHFAAETWRLSQASRSRIFFAEAHGYLGVSAWWRGRAEEALGHLEEASRAVLPGPYEGRGWGALLLHRARAGKIAEAQAMLAGSPGYLRAPEETATRSMGAWDQISTTAEALVVLGRMEDAAHFYPALAAYHGRGAVLRWLDGRLQETVVAMTAAAGGLWPEAEQHFAEALSLADGLPHRIEQAGTRLDWSRALLRRDAPGDRPRALGMLREAAKHYRQLEMPGHLETTEALIADISRDSGAA